MPLQISTQDALIGINTTNAKMYITQPQADILMETKLPRIEMHTEQIRVQIDQQQCFNESGLKDFKALTAEAAERGRQDVLAAIGRITSEGKRLAAIESGENALAEIAATKNYDIKEFGIVIMPQSKPDISFKGGTIDIKVDEGHIDYNVKPRKPEIQVEPGRVDYYLRQQPQISITYVGNNVDARL